MLIFENIPPSITVTLFVLCALFFFLQKIDRYAHRTCSCHLHQGFQVHFGFGSAPAYDGLCQIKNKQMMFDQYSVFYYRYINRKLHTPDPVPDKVALFKGNLIIT